MSNYLTSKQAAERLGVTQSAVLEMVKRGVLPKRRFGNAYVFLPSEVNRAKKRRRPGRPRKKMEAATK